MDILKEFEKLIKLHAHQITDDSENKWKVLELSDVEQIIAEYKESLVKKSSDIHNVSESACKHEAMSYGNIIICNKCKKAL